MKNIADSLHDRADRITHLVNQNGAGWLLVDWDEELNFLYYTTRQNGDIANGTPGKKDILSARVIREAILKEYPISQVTIDVIDEWTNLDVVFN